MYKFRAFKAGIIWFVFLCGLTQRPFSVKLTPNSSTLKTEATTPFEKSVYAYKITRHPSPIACTIHDTLGTLSMSQFEGYFCCCCCCCHFFSSSSSSPPPHPPSSSSSIPVHWVPWFPIQSSPIPSGFWLLYGNSLLLLYSDPLKPHQSICSVGFCFLYSFHPGSHCFLAVFRFNPFSKPISS